MRSNSEVFEPNNEEYYVWQKNLILKERIKFESWLENKGK